jgi:hypothetical protein
MELLIVKRKMSLFDKLMWGIVIAMSIMTLISYIEGFEFKQNLFIITGGVISVFIFFGEIYYISHKPFLEQGKILFSDDELIIIEEAESQSIKFDNLEYLKFEINETSLDKYFRGLFNKKKDGDQNFIEVKQADGTYLKFNTYIENAEKIKEIDDFVLNSNREEIKLLRQGKVVKSILEFHYKDYPKQYFNTSGKRYYKN